MTVQPALTFDGKDDYIEVPYSQQNNPTVFTVSSWVKVTGGQGHRSVITSRDHNPLRGYILYVKPQNKWSFWVGAGKATGPWEGITIIDVVLDTWTHVAISFDGSKQKLYINGTVASERAATYAPNIQRPLRIGAGSTESNPSMFFAGSIAEVCIWNKARTQEEIKADMGKRLTGKEPGLVGYWPLNDGSGTTVGGKTSGGKNGTINGGATWQQQDIPISPLVTTGELQVPSNSDTGVAFTNSYGVEMSYKFTPSGTWSLTDPKYGSSGLTPWGIPGASVDNLKYPQNTAYALLAVRSSGAVIEVSKETTIDLEAGETLTFLVNDNDYKDNVGTLIVDWSANLI